ncbi:hypothetical protein ACO0OL_000958 [Hanseniaspora opuntiae]
MSDQINKLHQSLSLMSIDDNDGNKHNISSFTKQNYDSNDNLRLNSNVREISRNSLESHSVDSPQFREVVSSNINDANFSDDADEQFVENAYNYKSPPEQNNHINDIMHTLVPVTITWDQGGNSVFVTGSFTEWRKMIALNPIDKNGKFAISLKLPVGNHRFRFIVDGELRISDSLPQATDQMGNFVNFLEVFHDSSQDVVHHNSPQVNSPADNYQHENKRSTSNPMRNKFVPNMLSVEQEEEERRRLEEDQSHMSKSSRIALQIARENDQEPINMGNGYERVPAANKGPILQLKSELGIVNSGDSSPGAQKVNKKLEYTHEIPAVFTDPQVMEQYYVTLDQQRNNQQYMAWLTPPQLPPHLEKVILNTHTKHNHENHLESHEDVMKEKEKENTTGALPIPNHVVLNHLITSSIKHNTLCVASTVRYKKKYVTQVLYAPL